MITRKRMLKSKYKCHCDFCQQEDADEIRSTTPHLTPNYTITGYPSGTQFDFLEGKYKIVVLGKRKGLIRSKMDQKSMKQRACASCEEYWIKFVDWVNNVIN